MNLIVYNNRKKIFRFNFTLLFGICETAILALMQRFWNDLDHWFHKRFF